MNASPQAAVRDAGIELGTFPQLVSSNLVFPHPATMYPPVEDVPADISPPDLAAGNDMATTSSGASQASGNMRQGSHVAQDPLVHGSLEMKDGSQSKEWIPDVLPTMVATNDPNQEGAKLPVESSEEDWDSANGIIGRLARLIFNHYYLVPLVVYVFVFILTGVVMLADADERCAPNDTPGQLKVCEASSHDWELSFSNASKFKDAVVFARTNSAELFQRYFQADTDQASERESVSDWYNIVFLFWHDNPEDHLEESIFTPHRVKSMCEIEAAVTFHPFYPYFCLLEGGTCREQILSVVRFFYPSDDSRNPAGGGCQLLSETEVADVAKNQVLQDFTSLNGYFARAESEEGEFTNSTRSRISLGVPLSGYLDEDEDKMDQRKLYGSMMFGTVCPVKLPEKYQGKNPCEGIADGTYVKGAEEVLFDRFKMEGFPKSGPLAGSMRTPYFTTPIEKTSEGDMQVRFFSLIFQSKEFDRVVDGDLNFAILSIVVVWAYIWFHTKSVFIANASMFQIVMSLPVGFFLYFNIFGKKYYSQLNILAIYLALGIGADSVFVFSDCWNQTRSIPSIRTTLGRLNYSLTRTIQSCFNTTLTTVMSFVATSITPVMPIHCFAVFASLVLCVDYLFVCILTPAIIMIAHIHFSDQGGCCCYCSRSCLGNCGPKESNCDESTFDSRQHDKCYQLCPYSKSVVSDDSVIMRQESAERSGVEKLTMSERFFHERFSPLICGDEKSKFKPGAITFLILLISFAGWMISEATSLHPPSEPEQFFPQEHTYNKEQTTRLRDGWEGQEDAAYLKIVFMFGITTTDRDGYNWLFPEYNRGLVTYDLDFNIKNAESQRFYMETCDRIAVATCDARACKDSGTLVKPGTEVTCLIRSMLQFYRTYHNDTSASVIPEDKFDNVAFEFFTDDTKMHEGTLADRMAKYLQLLGRDELRYNFVAVEFRSSATAPMTNTLSHELYDLHEELADQLRHEAPAGMKSLFQTDTNVPGVGWTWMRVEDALIQNLITGFSICFPVAFVVLVFATGNVIIALFATTAIACIVAGVLGAARAFYGWDLGIAESISGVIVIGFSVDYTVHLGHMYREAASLPSREEKTRFALTYMGTTVLGGGFTTLSAGLILFLCTLMFFTKMAVLLVWTIMLSVVYSLFYFMSLCALVGPEGEFGSIPFAAIATNLALRLRKPGFQEAV